jgi:Circadian oscillating protein COP23
MSGWRDRNERDAKPNTIDIYHKPGIQNNKNTGSANKFVTQSLFSFLAGLVSIVAFGSVIVKYSNVLITPEISKSHVNQYICQKNSRGNIETLLIRDNGERQLFITWSPYYDTAEQTCSDVVARLNKYTKSEAVKYIAYINTKDSIKLCAVENLGDNCSQENIILHIKSDPIYSESINKSIGSRAIDSISLDGCSIYPNLKIKGSNKISDDILACFIPWMENAQ